MPKPGSAPRQAKRKEEEAERQREEEAARLLAEEERRRAEIRQQEEWRTAIEQVLRQYNDAAKRFASEKDAAMRRESMVDVRNSIANLASSLPQISLGGCPEDFRAAFMKNVNAIGDQMRFIDENLMGVRGLFRVLGNPDAVQNEGSTLDANVANTLRELVEVAERYGVQ